MATTTTALEEATAKLALPPPARRQEIRERAGLSRRRLARDLGVSPQAVAFWEMGAEAGGREPQGENLVHYVTLLGHLALAEQGVE